MFLKTVWLVTRKDMLVELRSREMANAIRSVISRGEPATPPVSLDGVRNALDVFDTALAHARAA